MFKTAKNTIKNAAKDQVEFFLVLLTGVFVGSIFTLAYIKFWVKGDATFSDIGGMLAGVGTIGLLIVAIRTANAWKNQSYHQQKINSLDNYSLQIEKLYGKLIAAITSSTYIGNPVYESLFDETITDELNAYSSELNEALKLASSAHASIIRLEAIWGIQITSSIYPSIFATQNLCSALKCRQNIFNARNDATTTSSVERKKAQKEISNLYKQLKQ